MMSNIAMSNIAQRKMRKGLQADIGGVVEF